MATHDFGTPEERRRALEQITNATYGPRSVGYNQASEPDDTIEKLYESERQRDHTVGLIGLILFVGIGIICLLMEGVPFILIVGVIFFYCIVWYRIEHELSLIHI